MMKSCVRSVILLHVLIVKALQNAKYVLLKKTTSSTMKSCVRNVTLQDVQTAKV